MYLIFVSSLGQNVELAKNIEKELISNGVDTKVINFSELNLPLYNYTAIEEKEGIPQIIQDIAKEMIEADAYVFVSPEYNFSIPPVQTNAIAWLSRIGDDFRKLFTNKYIQLASFSGGQGESLIHTMRVQFGKLGSIVMPREILTTYQKPLKEDSLERIIKQFVEISSK